MLLLGAPILSHSEGHFVAGQRVPPVPDTLKRSTPLELTDRQPDTPPFSVRSQSSVTLKEDTQAPLEQPPAESPPAGHQNAPQSGAASDAKDENAELKKDEKDATFWRTRACMYDYEGCMCVVVAGSVGMSSPRKLPRRS